MMRASAIAPRSSRLPLACAAAVTVALLVLIPNRIAEKRYLNHVSGAWAVLADDMAHGVLYRPLLSDLGYGGTRDFPLHIALHGVLVRLGLSLRRAGHLIALLSACMLVAGAASGLAKRGAPRTLAWAVAALTLASRTAFMAVAGIRGDLLPVALGISGLALVPDDPEESSLPAALALSLAMVAKPTLVWALAGAFLSLASAGRLRAALELSATALTLTVAGLIGAGLASQGEMIASFRACAGGGGFSLSTLVSNLGYVRPGELAWIFGGVGLTLSRGRRAFIDPFCASGLACLPVTVVLYASRGIGANHLLDATVLGALAVGAALADAVAPRCWTRIVLVIATILGLSEAVLAGNMQMKPGELDRVVAALPPGPGPILSEHPWIPLLAGERAFLLDAFNLSLTRRASPAVDHHFLDSLDQCRFRAVVLFGKPETAPRWYEEVHFGPGFREHLLSHYALDRIAGAQAIYLPRCGSPTSRMQPPADSEAETLLSRGSRTGHLRLLLERMLYGHHR